MRTKEDFFFGKTHQGSKGITLQLNDIESLAEKVSDNFFTAQLNRMLQEHGGRLTIADESSLPHFWGVVVK
ncbi:hypothetical protein [Shewanella baltica]|uniref:hypothetical protein n=1 Tax=Shewanella baltica TaxID=62322 RepID=UPI00217D820C|nr:hypothetical protein [Shewanella baltica]MCS6180996.1 hypothetical protein [Shewanella baltica]MCS6257619.1 hypothetical protein [Shewanella baltica]